MKLILQLTVLISFLYSCSSNEQFRIEAPIYSRAASEEVNWNQKNLNDSTILFINENIANSKITIGNTRTDILNNLSNIKDELIQYCGGYDKYHNYVNPNEQKLVNSFFIVQKKGVKVQKLINSIVEHINNDGFQFSRIARDANEIDIFRHDPNQSYKTFSGINFENANLVEALNVITLYETFVLQAEINYLNLVLKKRIEKSM